MKTNEFKKKIEECIKKSKSNNGIVSDFGLFVTDYIGEVLEDDDYNLTVDDADDLARHFLNEICVDKIDNLLDELFNLN